MNMKYITCILLAAITVLSCNSNPGNADIRGVWAIDDYIIEKESEADKAVLQEAKAMLQENNNNVMYFSDSLAGSVMPNGDTLTQFPYHVEGDKLVIGDVKSNFKLKDKNTLHIYDEAVDLVVQFKRVK